MRQAYPGELAEFRGEPRQGALAGKRRACRALANGESVNRNRDQDHRRGKKQGETAVSHSARPHASAGWV